MSEAAAPMKAHLPLALLASFTLASVSAFAQTVPPDAPPPDAKTQPTPPAGDPLPTPPRTIEGNQPGGYDIKLRELEERVVDLKEKVFKSKTRLMLLREQLMHNTIAEAGAVVMHVNEMSSAFTLEQVLYTLDGERVFFQDNRDGKLDEDRAIQVFNGIVAPGDHLIGVELTYLGNGTMFSYIDGYQFKVRSTYSFVAEKGRISRIKVVGYERGGMTTDLQ